MQGSGGLASSPLAWVRFPPGALHIRGGSVIKNPWLSWRNWFRVKWWLWVNDHWPLVWKSDCERRIRNEEASGKRKEEAARREAHEAALKFLKVAGSFRIESDREAFGINCLVRFSHDAVYEALRNASGGQDLYSADILVHAAAAQIAQAVRAAMYLEPPRKGRR